MEGLEGKIHVLKDSKWKPEAPRTITVTLLARSLLETLASCNLGRLEKRTVQKENRDLGSSGRLLTKAWKLLRKGRLVN